MSKTGSKLLPRILLILIITTFIGITIWVRNMSASANPKTWAPWFNFYRSQNCALVHNATGKCYLLGTRVRNFPDNNNELRLSNLIHSLNLQVKNTKDGSKESNLNENGWHCQLFDAERQVDLQIYLPQRGDTFDCWPTTPLTPDQTLISP